MPPLLQDRRVAPETATRGPVNRCVKLGSGASVYVASKHAVEGLTKAAALEVAESGVRVNVVAPGPIETGMLNRFTGTAEKKAGLVAGVPVKRVGTPEEIAQTILFVASDKASLISGACNTTAGRKLAR